MRFCEMTKKDFNVGQTVYLKATPRRAERLPESEHLKKAIVTKVGRRYIYVKTDDKYGFEYTFDITRSFLQADACKYNSDWLLLLDPLQLEEEELVREYIIKIKKACTDKFGVFDVRLPLDKLHRICKIIDE